ncbi:hypothetical protein M8J75_004768 [Diaphorina citri]|nr:hypothetical protein M8J75_004768 [Diaphorina citri]
MSHRLTYLQKHTESRQLDTRENYIFFVSGVTLNRHIVQGLSLVGHVFSHHWFGSIVTAARWDFAWLNEAFGRYYEYFGLHLVTKRFYVVM